jgi:vacuolar-type H+-ATPase subunit D/Vma8
MGSIEQIDQLETYIIDLGNEIESVKKASDYLKLIEQFQEKIVKTSDSLSQSKEQLKLYQEIMESKLELFQTTSKNIEAKQQSLEQTQFNILSSLAELKQQQEKNEKRIISSFMEMNKVVNQNQVSLVGELKHIDEEQQSRFNSISKANKMFFSINTVLSVSIVGILVYLISK